MDIVGRIMCLPHIEVWAQSVRGERMDNVTERIVTVRVFTDR
jgi:hypothetical protein